MKCNFFVGHLTQNALGTTYPFIQRIVEGSSRSEVGGACSKASIYTLALHWLYIFSEYFLV